MRHLKAAAILLCILIFAAGISSLAVSQGTGVVGDITCDTDLILTWYVADRFFGFNAVQNALVQTAPPGNVLDLNRFNRGQFAPLFDNLNTARDPATGDISGRVITPEFLSLTTVVITMDDVAFQNFVNSVPNTAGVAAPLVATGVAGEAPECALLRRQLQRFFAAVSVQDIQTGFGLGGLNVNGNLNTNLNVNGNVNANTNTALNANGNANANVNTNTNTNTNTNVNDNTGGGGGDNGNGNGNDNGDDDDDGGGNSGPGGGGDDDDGGGNSGSG